MIDNDNMLDEYDDEQIDGTPPPEKVAPAWERFRRWLFDEIEDTGCNCGG